ncbi:cytochrome c3 family protein [Candidatus Kuenenia sp.]|uniref:cytochrome c3 family protein n=1 Tax=Candidatus Kuenenia sp. TaxID=2499824 RepID=UPI0032205398
MFTRKHLSVLSILSAIVVFLPMVWGASTFGSRIPAVLPPAKGSNSIFLQKSTSKETGKIVGKVTNTDRSPLSDITISIQSLTEETTYGSAFEDVATTNKKGKFKITGIAPGKYIVRATPSSDEFYLPNDKFSVKVKSGKKKSVKIKLSSSSHPDSEYVGSTVCLSCHPDNKDWQQTAHAKTIQTPASDTIVAPFNGDVITTDDGKVTFKAFIDGSNYKVTLYDLNNEDIFVTYSVVRTHGGVSIAGKQRYHVKIGDSHYILPIQYNNRNVDQSNPDAAWVSYNASTWYEDDGTLITTDVDTPPDKTKSFEQNCEGCHVTGLDITQNVNGEFVSDSKELGISCESCHGPGGLHVSEGGGKALYIVNPKYLATDRGNEVCGQCHVRVKNKDGENGADFVTEYPSIINGDKITPFIPGKILADYIEETDADDNPTAGYWDDNDAGSLGENASENNHSKKHHQQYQDFIKSHHYNYAGQKCYQCHEPHGKGNTGTPQLLKPSDNNKICITCHDDFAETIEKDGEVQNRHAKHEFSSSDPGGSLCTGCHMPKTAKSAVNNDISSHVFDIIKPYASKAMADNNTANDIQNDSGTVITNSCAGCHSTDTDYGVERWDEWQEKD